MSEITAPLPVSFASLVQQFFTEYLVAPVGHFKIPHLWPPKIPQAGRADYELVEVF